MNLGYDPKWAQVVALSFLEGPNGQTVVAGERGAAFTLNSCTVSMTVSRWGRGSVFFPSDTTSRNISTSSLPSVYTNVPQILQGSFYPADVSGLRYVFAYSTRIVLFINDGVLTLRIRTTASATPEYTITLAGISSGQWYDYAIRFNATGATLEVNGVSAGSVSWGAETHGPSSTFLRIGNSSAGSSSESFRGYFGPFRWTVGDERLEDAGQPAYRFPVLGDVDSIREKVIFHSRFEGLNNATSAVDTKGKAIVFSGSARLETGQKLAGVSSFRANGGTGLISHADFNFGTDDFAIEFFFCRQGNTGVREYIFSLMDESGIDHALSLSGSGFVNGSGTLRVAGVDVAGGSPVSAGSAFIHCAIVRQAGILSVFRGSIRAITYNIGSTPINSNGQFYIGKGGSAAPGESSSWDYIDELRITRGAARYNPALTSITAPTEFFSEFGPRSLSGTVIDADGNPLVRTVRAYHRLTGRLISETSSATDGTWSLPVADTGEHFVVVHDDVKNALIYDRVQPVLVT